HGPKDAPRHGFDHIEPGPLTAAKVAALLKKRDNTKPLCLFAGTRHPHVPWSEEATYDPAKIEVPPNHLATRETRAMRARYYTDIPKADDLLGEIMALVRDALGDDVVFIYTADHGGQWPFGKWNLYDVGIRIPLIVSYPGVVKPGTRTNAMV